MGASRPARLAGYTPHRRPLLLEQVRKEPEIGNLLVKSGLVTDPAPERVAAAAERIAVFRVETV